MSTTIRLAATVAVLGLLSACGPGGSRVLPSLLSSGAASAERASQSATNVHAGSATNVMAGSATNVHAGTHGSMCDKPGNGSVSCHLYLNVAVASIANPNLPASSVPGYHPADLQSAYGFAGVAGSGTIGLVEAYDDPNLESDLGVYRSTFGLAACTTANGCFTKIKPHTRVSAASAGWALEQALDVQMASAICPGCKIVVVEAPTTRLSDMMNAALKALENGATALSLSFYGPESSTYLQYEPWFQVMSEYAAIAVSSGDAGAGAMYPASSAYVVAVGGTTLARDGSARGWSETAWTDTSSGCSTMVAKPSWQKDAGCGHRTVADLAVVGDPATGVAAYNSYTGTGAPGGWSVVGGTSAGSPIVAAMYAASGAHARLGAGALYGNATAFNPIVSGTTAGCSPVTYLCSAMPGYNGPGGLGSPVGPATFRSASSSAWGFE